MPDTGLERDWLVRVTGLGVTADGRALIHDVDLAIRRGEIVTVIGPNGAGKSTMVRAILGLIQPAAGTVERRAGLVVGYVPQRLEIDRTLPLTVERFLRMRKVSDRGELRAALAEVGAETLLGRPIQDLSGGEMKRVLLARALIGSPDLLVLDEPTANIDVAGQAEFYDLIRGIRDRRQCGILLVSHDLLLVMAATDVVLCLNGHVCCSGTPDAVSQHPAYLELFGPGVAGSLGLYSHAHDHHHDLHGAAVPDAPEDGSAARPESERADG